MSDLRQHDDRVAQNAAEADITQRIAQKLAHLDGAPRPPSQARRGIQVVAQTRDGRLLTDDRAWTPGQSAPPMAYEVRQAPTPVGQDVLDAALARRGGFDLRRRQPYALDEASRRLQQAFGEDIHLRAAGKARLAGLGLLQDHSRPADVPAEVRRLKQAIAVDQREEATRPRRPSLQARLKALKQQLDQLLNDQGDEDEDEGDTGDWQDPRGEDLRASAEEECRGAARRHSHPRTNHRGVLINAAGEPITLRSQPY
jgi:hypothetical protein